MLKFKIFLVLLIALIYYVATYCVLSPGMCRYYVDYYILYDRSFSITEEHKFLYEVPYESIAYFQKYEMKNTKNIKVLGATAEDENGLWSNGNTVIISFLLPQVYTNIELDFDVSGYINKNNRQVDVQIYHNDRQIGDWHFVYGRKKIKTKLQIAKKYLQEGSPINLIFKINGIASPQSLGYGSETKKFGLIFNALKILPYD